MSKKPKQLKTTSATDTATTLPKLNIKTTWDLQQWYYQDESDPHIEADVAEAERLYARFKKRYQDGTFLLDDSVLLKALREIDTLIANPRIRKPVRYFAFRKALNVSDSVANKKLNVLSERLTKAGNQILFFEIQLGTVPAAKQKDLLNADAFADYRYYLRRLFLQAKHHLSEAEERILNRKAGPSHHMWSDMTEQIIGERTLTYKKKTLSLNEAVESLNTLPPKEKPKLWSLIMSEMAQIGEVAQHELTAILTDMKIEDDLRGYKKPYSATVLSYQDDETSVENLIDAISTKGFDISQSFYKHKAKCHGEKQLPYARKYDQIGILPKLSYEAAVELCRETFYGLKDEYGAIFDRLLEQGLIDTYPRAGKRGGAFMSESVNLPTHVFLNHTDDLNSLKTLAHEMGHAIHAERAKTTQPPRYQGHSITTAETASTLFENLVFERYLQSLTPNQQLVALDNKITQNIATIQRQIAFFNYELDIHTTLRAQGALSKEELQSKMQTHLQAYLGPAVSVAPEDGHSYVYVSHFRYGFYVYTYTFGILMSNTMAARYYEDPAYIEQIDAFLCAGESDTVANIFKSIGLNTRKLDTFMPGLALHQADIDHYQKLVKEKK